MSAKMGETRPEEFVRVKQLVAKAKEPKKIRGGIFTLFACEEVTLEARCSTIANTGLVLYHTPNLVTRFATEDPSGNFAVTRAVRLDARGCVGVLITNKTDKPLVIGRHDPLARLNIERFARPPNEESRAYCDVHGVLYYAPGTG